MKIKLGFKYSKRKNISAGESFDIFIDPHLSNPHFPNVAHNSHADVVHLVEKQNFALTFWYKQNACQIRS